MAESKAQTYKVSSNFINQLDQLIEIERKEADKYNLKTPTKSSIIETALNEYYLRKLDKKGGDVFATFIQDIIKEQLELYHVAIAEILQQCLINELEIKEYTSLLVKGSEELKRIKIDDEMKYMVESPSRFEVIIKEKISKRLTEE